MNNNFKIIIPFIILSFCLRSDFLFSQNRIVDSLIQRLNILNQNPVSYENDTNKVNTCNALSSQLRYSDPDTAIFFSNKALEILKSLSQIASPKSKRNKINLGLEFGTWELGLGTSLSNTLSKLGSCYYLKADYSTALDFYLKALKVDKSLNNKKGIAACLGNIGLVCWNQGDYLKALDYYFKALKINKELGDKNKIAIQFSNIGIVYYDQGDYPKALNYYFKYMKLAEELGKKSYKANAIGNIGMVYFNQSNYSKALEYYFMALKINEELGNKNHIAAWLGNIGTIYHQKASSMKSLSGVTRSDSLYQKALEYYLKALSMDDELGNKKGVAVNLDRIAIVYTDQKEFDKAREYYFQSLKIAEQLGNDLHTAELYGNIGSLYTKDPSLLAPVGEEKKGYDLAEKYLWQATIIDSTIGAQNGLKQDYNLLSILYDTLGHLAVMNGQWQRATKYYQLSNQYFKKTMVLHDTLFNMEKDKDMTRLTTNHEWEMKLLRQEQDEKEKRREEVAAINRRNKLQYSIILMVFILLLSFVLLIGKIKLNTKIAEGIIFITFLIFFEFLLVFIDPYIDEWTGGAPGWKLLINTCIAAMIFPLHTFFDKWFNKRLLNGANEIKPHSRNISPIHFFSMYLIFAFVVTLNSGFDNKTDSLLMLIQSGKNDTNKVKHLNDLGWELMYSNPDSAILLSHNAIAILSKAKNLPEKMKQMFLANTLLNLGTYHWAKDDYPVAIGYYQKVLKIDEILNYKKGIAACLGNIGMVYWSQGNYPKALDYYFKALKINQELKDKNGIAARLGNIGLIYWNQGDYSKALDYYFKALRIAEELRDKDVIVNQLGNIGLVYWNHGNILRQKCHCTDDGGNYSKALDYYFKALRIAEELRNKNRISVQLGNIGIVYDEQGDYSNALNYYFKALKINDELGNKKGMAIRLGNIGSLYTTTGKFIEAEEYLKKAIAFGSTIGAQNELRQFEESLSQLYDTLVQLSSGKGQYVVAVEYLRKSSRHYKKARVLQDSLFNMEKDKDMTRLATNYEWEMKLLKQEQEEKEKRREEVAVAGRRNTLQYTIILVGIVALFIMVSLLGKIKLKPKFTGAIIFITFLIFFEFLLVLIDPYLEAWTGGAPGWKLLVNALVAVLIFPLHGFFETKLKNRFLISEKENKTPSGNIQPVQSNFIVLLVAFVTG